MRRAKYIEIIGRTTDGKYVVKGVFPMADTMGLPLDHIFDLCDANDMMPCWESFYLDAKQAGWKVSTIISKLSESIASVYGPDMRDVVIAHLSN